MSPELRNQLKFALKLIVAAVLIFFVFRSGHLKLKSLEALMTMPTVAILLLFIGINLWLLNWRWYWLLRSLGFNVSLRSTFSLYLIGVFFNHALPSSIGGDVVKAYYIASDQSHRRIDAVLSVLVDRALGLYSMLLLSLLSVVWDYSFVVSRPEIRVMATICLVLFIGMSLAFLIGFSKRVDKALRFTVRLQRLPRLHFIAKVFNAMQIYGEKRLTILVSILVSIAAQLVSVGFFVFVAWALGTPMLSLAAYVFCVPLGFVAMALPIAPAGVGVGQVAFLFLFQAYAQDSGDSGAVAITAFQLAMLSWGLIGSIFYIRHKKPLELRKA